jgi:hypothetical protein
MKGTIHFCGAVSCPGTCIRLAWITIDALALSSSCRQYTGAQIRPLEHYAARKSVRIDQMCTISSR